MTVEFANGKYHYSDGTSYTADEIISSMRWPKKTWDKNDRGAWMLKEWGEYYTSQCILATLAQSLRERADPKLKEEFERRKKNQSNKKWAYIIVGNTRMCAAVDNVTMEAYKVDGRTFTEMKWPRFKFDRWMNGLDL